MVVYHHSRLQCNQEGHHFITSGFIGPPILNFARNLSLYPGPQSILEKILLKVLANTCFCMIDLTLALHLAFIALLLPLVPVQAHELTSGRNSLQCHI
jgi:hypothetical protein